MQHHALPLDEVLLKAAVLTDDIEVAECSVLMALHEVGLGEALPLDKEVERGERVARKKKKEKNNKIKVKSYLLLLDTVENHWYPMISLKQTHLRRKFLLLIPHEFVEASESVGSAEPKKS